jgi:hypothetical protein
MLGWEDAPWGWAPMIPPAILVIHEFWASSEVPVGRNVCSNAPIPIPASWPS